MSPRQIFCIHMQAVWLRHGNTLRNGRTVSICWTSRVVIMPHLPQTHPYTSTPTNLVLYKPATAQTCDVKLMQLQSQTAWKRLINVINSCVFVCVCSPIAIYASMSGGYIKMLLYVFNIHSKTWLKQLCGHRCKL